MPARARVAGTLLAVAGLAASPSLVACSSGSSSSAVSAPPTSTSPTAQTSSSTPSQPRFVRLEVAVRRYLRHRSGSVDESQSLNGLQRNTRVLYAQHGSVVDVVLPPTGKTRAGLELFRSPTLLAERVSGAGHPCWWLGSREAARIDYATQPELDLLSSVKPLSRRGIFTRARVSALDLLRTIGPDAELRTAGLLRSPSARVTVRISGNGSGLEIDTSLADVLRAEGLSTKPSAAQPWILRYGTGPAVPIPPTPGLLVRIHRTDPQFDALLSQCEARNQ